MLTLIMVKHAALSSEGAPKKTSIILVGPATSHSAPLALCRRVEDGRVARFGHVVNEPLESFDATLSRPEVADRQRLGDFIGQCAGHATVKLSA